MGDFKGQTPLTLAMGKWWAECPPAETSKRVEVVKELLDAGVDVNLEGKSSDPSSSGDSATGLMLACLQGSVECVSLLLAANAQIDAQNSLGNNALHFAAQYGICLSLSRVCPCASVFVSMSLSVCLSVCLSVSCALKFSSPYRQLRQMHHANSCFIACKTMQNTNVARARAQTHTHTHTHTHTGTTPEHLNCIDMLLQTDPALSLVKNKNGKLPHELATDNSNHKDKIKKAHADLLSDPCSPTRKLSSS
jgi:hypothetical protein